MRRHRSRRPRPVLGLVAAAVLTGGISCSSDPVPPAGPIASVAALPTVVPGSTLVPPAPPAGVPDLVGRCRANGSRRAIASSFDDQPVIPCSGPHGLETYGVGLLPFEWATARYPDRFTDDDQRLTEAMGRICTTELFDAYYGVRRQDTPVGLRRPLGPIGEAWFIPNRHEWAAGARWVRCDLHVVWDDPTGALTTSLRGRYDEVAATPLGGACNVRGQWEEIPVPCGEPHVLEGVTQYSRVPGGRPAEDGDRAALDEWRGRCREDALRYLGTTAPAPGLHLDVGASGVEDWARGEDQRTVSCRVGFKDGDQFVVTTGSARGLGDRPPEPAP